VNPEDPQDLDAALAAYRRLPRAEPTAALDAAIRAHAQAALARRARPRWPVLFATAATLVLAASLGWRAWRVGSDQPAPLVQGAAVPAASAPAGAPATAGAAREHADAETAPAPPEDLRERTPDAPPVQQPANEPADAASTAIGAFARAKAPAAEQPLPQAFEGAPATPAPAAAPPPAPAPPAPVEEPPATAESAVAAGLAKKSEAALPDAESRGNVLAAPAAADGAELDRAAAQAPLPAAGLGAARAVSAVGRDEPRRQAVAATAADALQPIRELLRQGRRDEARAALAQWRRDWPDAPLPEDLQALLR